MSKRTAVKDATAPPKKPRPRGARLRVTHPHAAGIDVHSDVHWVAVPPEHAPPPPPEHPPHLPANVRSFGPAPPNSASESGMRGRPVRTR